MLLLVNPVIASGDRIYLEQLFYDKEANSHLFMYNKKFRIKKIFFISIFEYFTYIGVDAQ